MSTVNTGDHISQVWLCDEQQTEQAMLGLVLFFIAYFILKHLFSSLRKIVQQLGKFLKYSLIFFSIVDGFVLGSGVMGWTDHSGVHV